MGNTMMAGCLTGGTLGLRGSCYLHHPLTCITPSPASPPYVQLVPSLRLLDVLALLLSRTSWRSCLFIPTES
jgi:hypothetical protein